MDICPATLVAQFYNYSQKITAHNEYELSNYQRDGYNIVGDDSNYPIHLAKEAKLIVVVDVGGETFSFDIKDQVRRFYGRKIISPRMAEKFEADVRAGNITLSTDRTSLFIEKTGPITY